MSISLMSRFRRIASRRIEPPTTDWTPSGQGRTRVVLECARENSPAIVESILDQAGYDVVVCEGPDDHRCCPVVAGEYCPAVQAADVVVNMLGDGTPERRDVLGAVLESGPRRPAVVAMVNDPSSAEVGLRAVDRRVGTEDLVHAIEAAIDDAARPAAWWGGGS